MRLYLFFCVSFSRPFSPHANTLTEGRVKRTGRPNPAPGTRSGLARLALEPLVNRSLQVLALLGVAGELHPVRPAQLAVLVAADAEDEEATIAMIYTRLGQLQGRHSAIDLATPTRQGTLLLAIDQPLPHLQPSAMMT